MEVKIEMNKLEHAVENREASIGILLLKAYSLLEQQGLDIPLIARYIKNFGLCFIVLHKYKKMLIKASVFFDLAEENMLTIENIKRNSI